MTTEITIAVISSIAAIAAAIIASIQTVRTTRLKADSDLAIEKLKLENDRLKTATELAIEKIKGETERRKNAYQIACQDSMPIEIALSNAWEEIQKIKDAIALLLAPEQYDVDLALKSIRVAVENITTGYAKDGSNLSASARDAWHKAKKNAIVLEMKLLKINNATGDSNDALNELINFLREMRTILTDYQMILADERQNYRNVCIKNILQIL